MQASTYIVDNIVVKRARIYPNSRTIGSCGSSSSSSSSSSSDIAM